MVSPSPIGSTVSVPPRGIVCCAMTSMFSSSLTRFFGSNSARQVPGDLGLGVLDMAARHRLGIAEIDLGAGGTGGAEGQPAELQPGGSGLRALADQIEREIAVFRLGIVVQTSRPLTMAPTGLMRSWQTREHSSAASSSCIGSGRIECRT